MDGYSDDHMMDVSHMMESNMEEGDEEDYENQMVEVEPEIFLDNVNDGFDDDGAAMFGVGGDSSNQFFDDSFNDSSLGGAFGSGGENSNDDYSSSGFPRPGSSASGSRGGNKTPLGTNCPICGQVLHRQHSRDHVAWHFMDELKEMIAEPGACPDPGCEYTGDKTENICRHLALYHGKLDDFLNDQALVEEKRVKAMLKPRKV